VTNNLQTLNVFAKLDNIGEKDY